jgi:hypothetical protein
MKAINKNNWDELLFDYFEGNLNADEKRKVERFTEENLSFKEEFDLWKNSFVTEPLAEINEVEKLLLKINTPTLSWIKIGFFGFLILSIVSFDNPWKEEKVDGANEKKPAISVIQPLTTNVIADSYLNEKIKILKSPLEKSKPISLLENTGSADTTIAAIVIPKEESKANNTPEEINLNQLKDSIAIVKTVIAINKKEERKKIRAIIRQKRKAEAIKKQQEFMKGDRPYTVPLNTQNF